MACAGDVNSVCGGPDALTAVSHASLSLFLQGAIVTSFPSNSSNTLSLLQRLSDTLSNSDRRGRLCKNRFSQQQAPDIAAQGSLFELQLRQLLPLSLSSLGYSIEISFYHFFYT